MRNLSHSGGVIVADDDPIIQDVVRANLEAINQDVFLAVNGLEAIALARVKQASLVLLDIEMPELGGLPACKRIRELPGYADTPIIMLTAQDTEAAQSVASGAGATMFLAKPFTPAALMQSLSIYLPISESTRQIIHNNAIRAAGGKVFRTILKRDGF